MTNRQNFEVYLNLTNGLEALEWLRRDDYRVIRIQSTACEQKRWGFILSDLDNGLLFDLAAGKYCLLVDYTGRESGSLSRALFQGVEWIKYVLYRTWLGKEYVPCVRGNNTLDYFDDVYRGLDKSVLKKILYFKKFLDTDDIHLIPVGGHTIHDGDYGYYSELVKIGGK